MSFLLSLGKAAPPLRRCAALYQPASTAAPSARNFFPAVKSVRPASLRILSLMASTAREVGRESDAGLFMSLDMSLNAKGRHTPRPRQGGRRLISQVANYKSANSSESEAFPVWLWLVDSLFRETKSVFQFLYEQPGQLQHIEWPTVNTVVKMAVLTLIVVTCLIVLLATVDSTMSYVLASLLRRLP